MIDSHSLGVELDRAAPHTCMRELIDEVLMDLHESRFDCETFAATRQDKRLRKIWRLARAFCIDSHEAKLLPYFIQQNVDT